MEGVHQTKSLKSLALFSLHMHRFDSSPGLREKLHVRYYPYNNNNNNRGARPAVFILLINLIQKVFVSRPIYGSTYVGPKLLNFLTACLVKPNHGGMSRNLITNIIIIKQIRYPRWALIWSYMCPLKGPQLSQYNYASIHPSTIHPST